MGLHSRRVDSSSEFKGTYTNRLTHLRGPIIFLGGTLLVITSILEFILGNTFPCVVFGTIGNTLQDLY